MDSSIRKDFMSTFPDLVTEIENHMLSIGFPAEALQHISHCLNTNTTNGKLHRGLAVVSTSRSLLRRPLNDKESKELFILGWLVELFQAAYLVWDDIMDDSYTRRGQPCWYRQPQVGTMAINDACLLKSSIFVLLKRYFVEHSAYFRLIGLFLDAGLRTELGQYSDLSVCQTDFRQFTIEKYHLIVEFKSSYYCVYLPISLALECLHLATPKNLEQTWRLAIILGQYFQAQDDYLDVFSDPAVTGKIGTDIEDNKCTWVVIEAIIRCDKTQRTELQLLYGKKDMLLVSKVKALFEELGLRKAYKSYEAQQRETIAQMIDSLDESEGLTREVFRSFFSESNIGREVTGK